MEIKHDHVFPILSKRPNVRFIYRHDLGNWTKTVSLPETTEKSTSGTFLSCLYKWSILY